MGNFNSPLPWSLPQVLVMRMETSWAAAGGRGTVFFPPWLRSAHQTHPGCQGLLHLPACLILKPLLFVPTPVLSADLPKHPILTQHHSFTPGLFASLMLSSYLPASAKMKILFILKTMANVAFLMKLNP